MFRRKPPPPPPVTLDAADHERMRLLLSLVNDRSQPNLNYLNNIVRETRSINLNIKSFGYDLAQRLAAALPRPAETAARHVGLPSKLSIQADLETDWAAHWSRELGIPIVYHRKVWEFMYLLQALHDGGHLVAGARGLGFGCGTEPIPSYLAAQGVAVTMTDLPAARAGELGWVDTNQHAESLAKAFHPNLVDWAAFERLVSLREVDMNAIPADLTGYDFCWSVCALEHLGSIEQGLAFIENALDCLRPGGTAVHTTEFNLDNDGPTIDNWMTVLFQQKHFEEVARRLAAKGHRVAPFDFDAGDRPMDGFIDLPPWSHDLPANVNRWLGQPNHLKLSADGFVVTCIGITVTKAG